MRQELHPAGHRGQPRPSGPGPAALGQYWEFVKGLFVGRNAVTDSDLPIIVATVLVAGSIIVIANVIVDLLYAVIDPRVRLA